MKMRYLEMPLPVFLFRYPQFVPVFPPDIFADSRYIVRFDPSSGCVEIGFVGDTWHLN